ncbi:DNA REPAIR PROTEIN XRCC3 [Salix koriyanagi]|uniref:DNA REPAIR PROTEIN XRCC3 n=2 Tax=Salix TaxID=40685 RepID=A0A9Q0W360_9ROSI|nr:DNA REPAIR PROTEIN XRCC3 [Salix koriyanagi]
MGGGIPCNSITEIVAESGSGKTQFCLQLSLRAQLPPFLGGLSASSLYLYTEFPFPTRRLHQLSSALQSQYPQIFVNNYDPCDGIFLQSVNTADQLLDIMPQVESFLENSKTRLPVRVIVIDSMAALFRAEFDNTASDLIRRSSLFFKISGKLKEFAKRFNLVVLVTNQVMDVVDSGEGANEIRIGNLNGMYSSGRRISPALGLSWANCVNSRLFLSKDEYESGSVGGGESGSQSRGTRRRLHVVFAPHLPGLSCEFVIRREGVLGVNR